MTKLTKKEISKVKNIFEKYTGKRHTDEKIEEIFIDFINLMKSLLKK